MLLSPRSSEKGIGILREEFRTSGDGLNLTFRYHSILWNSSAWRWSGSPRILGRAGDLDVMDAKAKTITRADLNLPPRKCLICENEAAVCSAAQSHEKAAIEARVNEILLASRKIDLALLQTIGRLALTATLYEAAAAQAGSRRSSLARAHEDMDYLTSSRAPPPSAPGFPSSRGSAHPWGRVLRSSSRAEGGRQSAERDMFAARAASHHKGSSSRWDCSAPRPAAFSGPAAPRPRLLRLEAAAIVSGISERDFAATSARAPTVGERLYLALAFVVFAARPRTVSPPSSTTRFLA